MCPNCHHPKSRIDETRRIGGATWRWRECLNCKTRFWTTETVSEVAPRPTGPTRARTFAPQTTLQ